MHIPQNQKEWDSIAEIKFGKIFHWILKNERAFGRMMLEFEDIIFDKDRCPIMSTDGINLYINPIWLNEAKREDIIFTTFHECLHCALNHFEYTKWAREYAESIGIDPGYVHLMLNVATDEEINSLLFSSGITTELDVCYSPDLYPDPIWQNIFKELLDRVKNNQGGSGDPDGESDGDDDTENTQNSGQKPSDSGDLEGESDDGEPEGNEAAEGENSASENSDGDQIDIDKLPQDIKDRIERSQRTGDYDTEIMQDSECDTDEEINSKELIKTRWENAFMDSVELSQRQQGSSGKFARMMSEKMDEDRVDWKSLFEEFLINTYPNDFTMAWPDESFIEDDIYVPTIEGEEMQDLLLVADCSGSINQDIFSDMINRFNNAAMSVKKMSGRIIFWDYTCKGDYEFNETNLPLNNEELIGSVSIGSDTEFNGLFRYVKEKKYDVGCMVVLTDRYFPNIIEDVNYPVMCLDYGTDDRYKGQVPFARIIPVEQ